MPLLRIFILLVTYLISAPGYSNTFESLVMPGEVIDGHKKVETKCSSCHELFSSKGQNKLCMDCHKDTRKDIKSKKGFHGKNKSIAKVSCKSCHTEHKGRDADIVKLDEATFNHNKTDFVLKGKHKLIECQFCHKKNKKFREAKNKCRICHKNENPHKKAKAKKKTFKICSGCHQEFSWHKIKFNHNKKTKFKLTGAHKKALCQSCHINEKYLKTPKTCISCHKLDDVHDGDNGTKCQKCHNTKKWGKISFNHDRDTSFRLRNKHKKATCSACHKEVKISKNKNKRKKKKARKCYSCHSNDDSHNGRVGKKCAKCHNDKSWSKTKFKHDSDTKFKIKGKHKKLSCNQCHTTRTKKSKLKTGCIHCHKSDDIHKGSLGAKCQSCHTESSWKKKVKFDHDLTHFPLIGMHGAVSCSECHIDSDYKKLKNKCVSCHKNKDVHKGKLGRDCHVCHTPNDWGVWVFNHNKQSKFKINGAHKKVHCHTCHSRQVNNVSRIPRDCRNCHSGDDIHNGQFGTRCNDCHTTKNFLQIRMR